MSQMFTTCAACRMNLAVTPSDLRIGQGYVRCGRCNRVFNALLSLSEDLEVDEPGLAATGTVSVPALEDPLLSAPVEAATGTKKTPGPAPDEDASWVRRAATGATDVVETQATGTFETIVLEGDTYLQTEEHVDANVVDAQLQELARQIDTRNADGLAEEDDADEVDEDRPDEEIILETDVDADADADEEPEAAAESDANAEATAGEPATPEVIAAEPPEAELDADAAVGNRRRSHWLWMVTVTVLGLMLAAQLVHHNRKTLVTHPRLEAPMRSLYGLFGVNLEPRWNVKAYDLRQLGAESPPGASDKVVLRATVQNSSRNKQPPPLIRVVLQDKFGNPISTEAVAPADYLGAVAPTRMAPDQRLDITLTLSDPARQAMGFEIDACLATADGRLHCSNDK